MAVRETTPLMQQYISIKSRYPDAMLLFRVGDFYETFNEDAVKASRVLGIVLTKRSNGAASDMDLAGFPHHSLDTYLPRLVRAGLRVAICDQLEDAKHAKTIVKRGVTELITPGVTFSDKILDHKSNNFLASYYRNPGAGSGGLALVDASTGEFFIAEGKPEYLDKLLQGFSPSETLVARPQHKLFDEEHEGKYNAYALEDWVFQPEYARETLLNHFGTASLKGFGIESFSQAIIAAGAAIHYLQLTQQVPLSHIQSVSRIDEADYVWLDRFTVRNLELVSSPHEQSTTLLDVLDLTVTPMGARMLRRWLLMPLKDITAVNERLDLVDYFVRHPEFNSALEVHLKTIGDLERLTARIALRKLTPREASQLKRAVTSLKPVRERCAESGDKGFEKIISLINPCEVLLQEITAALVDDPPSLLNKGGVIRQGYSKELDELRAIVYEGKDYLLRIQREESERTGISSLKVAYNSVFGYYIEVTNSHKHKVPAEWVRKQTLTNAERYITGELKQYEEKILVAEESISVVEEKLYTGLLTLMNSFVPALQQNASQVAKLDVLCTYAKTALLNNYCKPVMNDGLILHVKSGRHPVLEKQLPPGESYIPNDLYLDPSSQQLIMITGPNMSGKSAVLRQTALIVLMAQAGSFVPAQYAAIGMVDKIFTRVGASDNISQGESTFMVEMNETASILHNLSERSLVLLDEIGRGTSTYDGISIAWAIAEFLHEHPRSRPKTLFATHYHELNEMASQFPRIRNFNIAIRESGNQVLFLRKLVAGGSEHSFGIHVAKMAGMPAKVLQRAEEMLKTLENAHSSTELVKASHQTGREDFQLSFFNLDDPLLARIREEITSIDINTLTPVEALMKLNEIKKLITRDKANG